jgi:hypothetical protein
VDSGVQDIVGDTAHAVGVSFKLPVSVPRKGEFVDVARALVLMLIEINAAVSALIDADLAKIITTYLRSRPYGCSTVGGFSKTLSSKTTAKFEHLIKRACKLEPKNFRVPGRNAFNEQLLQLFRAHPHIVRVTESFDTCGQRRRAVISCALDSVEMVTPQWMQTSSARKCAPSVCEDTNQSAFLDEHSKILEAPASPALVRERAESQAKEELLHIHSEISTDLKDQLAAVVRAHPGLTFAQLLRENKRLEGLLYVGVPGSHGPLQALREHASDVVEIVDNRFYPPGVEKATRTT